MAIKKDADAMAFYNKVSTKKVKLYYSGERVIPVLEHPHYGVFDFEESDSSFSVPKGYAKALLEASPNLFSLEKTAKQGIDGMSYKELLEAAEDKGYDSKKESRKKEDLIKFLAKSEE